MRSCTPTLTLIAVVVLHWPCIGQEDPALSPLIKNLKHKDDKERIKAMRALAELGAKAKPAADALCEAAAQETKPEMKKEARAALAKVRPDLAPHVTTLLDSTEGRDLVAAAEAIGKMGPTNGAAGSWALRFGNYRCDRGRFADPSPVAAACITALGDVQPADKDVIHEVGQAATLNKNTEVRVAGVRALGKLGVAYREQRKSVVSYLGIALRDRDAAVRVAGLQSAGSLGPDAKTLLKSVQAATKDESEEVRKAAEAAQAAIAGK